MREDSYIEWRRKDFEEVPRRAWSEDIGPFDSMVILPSRLQHDSGYGCMDFVAIRDGVPVARLSGCSDVVHIDGIGGYGMDWVNRYQGVPTAVPPSAWSIDCLPKSALLQLWSTRGSMTAAKALSSFEVYATHDRKG